MKKDSLGQRMKTQYENRTRYHLPRRTYTLIRLDGKAFHSYTVGLQRPFDFMLMEDMDLTAKALCEHLEGVQIAYVQSDEISLLLTDFGTIQSEAYFDGNIQKMTSVSASVATAHFNHLRARRALPSAGISDGEGSVLDALRLAYFDSRVFTIPDPVEVANYFNWRQQDASRNSVQMAARAAFPHEECENKSSAELQEMLFTRKGINWSNYPDGCKRGRCVARVPEKRPARGPAALGDREPVDRFVWTVVAPPIFSKDWEWLYQYIPRYEYSHKPSEKQSSEEIG